MTWLLKTKLNRRTSFRENDSDTGSDDEVNHIQQY